MSKPKRKTLLHRAHIDAKRRYREGTVEHSVFRVVARFAWLRGYRAALRAKPKRKPTRSSP